MWIEALTIGNELLSGDLADTNTRRFGALLRGMGLVLRRGETVPDTLAVIVEVMRQVGARADVVLVSGGLGPTEDDLTLEAAAAAAGVELVEHAETVARLREKFGSRGYALTPNNLRQARVPAGAEVFDNPVGTAPHVQCVIGRARFFFFPGVPRELERLCEDHLRPWLAAKAGVRAYASRTFLTFGRTESQTAALLEAVPRDARMHVAYRAHFPVIQVTLHVEEPDEAARVALLDGAAERVRQALGEAVFSEDGKATLAGVVGAMLAARGQTLALAESCTGGMVAAMLTEVAGASAYLREGFVVYANEAKMARLGVTAETIAEHGAVSEATARAMAEGARRVAEVDWAIAVTGIAGPGGGTKEKPVGTVHIAVAGPDGVTHVARRFPFDRERNRVVSAYAALELLRQRLKALGEAE